MVRIWYSQTPQGQGARAKKIVFKKQFDGFPKETDLELVEEQLPGVKHGEFLVEALYLSIDPFMRSAAPWLQVGTTFIGDQVGKVIESKNPNYPVGTYVVGPFGCRTHTITDGKNLERFWTITDVEEFPLSYSMGVLGQPGNTAYFGFLEICQPKAGETVVVTGAAGAVGNIVGQIAKIKGCTVIGIAGSEEKGKWLVDDLKFHRFINYKDEDFEKKLIEATPKGVDCFFDNVGGELFSIILTRMNTFGRIAACGFSSSYNSTGTSAQGTPLHRWVVGQQLKIEGFLVSKWLARWQEGIEQNKQWVREGKLKYREAMTEGFENMFKAFVDMLNGTNVGKAVVKIE